MTMNSSGLSERENETIRLLVYSITSGRSLREAAKLSGMPMREAEARLAELRSAMIAMSESEASRVQ